MKKTLVLLTLLIAGFNNVHAQNFDSGLELYQQGDYERAIQILSQSSEAEALLFTGKSYFALNNYLKSLLYLKQIGPESPIDIYHDALHTSALAHFQLDNFKAALEIAKVLIEFRPTTDISRSANPLYKEILGFLTTKQRYNVFRQTSNEEIRLDLLESAIGRVKYQTANVFLNYYKNSAINPDINRINRIETLLSDSVFYYQNYNPTQPYTAPRGISYNIGVVLPEFEFDNPNYEIPQHLYFGIQLAIEQFNSENQGQKAFITFRDTGSDSLEPEFIINDLVWNHNTDVIIGPLFSNMAKQYSGLAEDYEIPLLLPLANADSLDLYNDYVFQINPNFETQGKIMARYAVNNLEYDTVGVIAELGALGAPAARAFKHEVERLGGFVEYYFEENLEIQGYDIRDYTKFFTTDTLDSVAMVEAVYAPFTGVVAPTLIESMMTDLEAMRSTVAILGSAEWSTVNLETRRLPETELYYTESLNVDTSASGARAFASEFRLRFQTEPNQFAYIGYDVADIVLKVLKRVKNPESFREHLSRLNNYRGLSSRISFRGTHVNQEVKVMRMPRDSDEYPDENEGNSVDGMRRQ